MAKYDPVEHSPPVIALVGRAVESELKIWRSQKIERLAQALQDQKIALGFGRSGRESRHAEERDARSAHAFTRRESVEQIAKRGKGERAIDGRQLAGNER